MEDAHRRTRAVQRLPALAWRRGRRRAVYANRARLKSGFGRETMRRRGELVERPSPMSSIAAACDGHGCADGRTSTSAT